MASCDEVREEATEFSSKQALSPESVGGVDGEVNDEVLELESGSSRDSMGVKLVSSDTVSLVIDCKGEPDPLASSLTAPPLVEEELVETEDVSTVDKVLVEIIDSAFALSSSSVKNDREQSVVESKNASDSKWRKKRGKRSSVRRQN